MLHELVTAHRDELIRRCRAKVEARSVPPPTPAELECGVPRFLDQLVDALRDRLVSNAEIDRSAAQHGRDLQVQGFTVSQVVHDYGDVCQSITDMAVETGAAISVDEFRRLNQCLDDAIASAVTEYARDHLTSVADAGALGAQERFGFLAHELRNLISTASVAFQMLERGNVGVRGSTGAVLKRSLDGLRDLINRSVTEVRLRQVMQDRVHIVVAELIDELAPAAALEAANRGLQFAVQSGEVGAAVYADRHVLSAVLMNLLQNAFKFTRVHTSVGLSVRANADRVLIEIADQCGGLADGDVHELFRPFEQRNADRTGLGLGLAFSHWGVEANDGQISVRNVPDHGCVFTVDLPRVATPAMAMA